MAIKLVQQRVGGHVAGNFYGADVAQLRRLAKDLAGSAQRLNQLGQQLSGTISISPWKGNDGDRFRGDWTSSHLRALKAASAGIDAASEALLLNAGEQERSSQGGAGSPLGGVAANSSGTARELTDILGGMTPAERAAYLLSNEFQDWALRTRRRRKPRWTQRLILGGST